MDKPSVTVRGRLARIGAVVRKAWLAEAGADGAAPVEYLYVPCARTRYRGRSAQTRRWVQAVPVVRKTAQWIYYASDSFDPIEAVVSPGRISRQEFETGTRGVIPVPGARPGAAGRLFFATRQAAEYHLYHAEREGAPIRELRRAMADAHPDRGGTAEQFIEARRRYQTALRSA
jgi:hypothetical protein